MSISIDMRAVNLVIIKQRIIENSRKAVYKKISEIILKNNPCSQQQDLQFTPQLQLFIDKTIKEEVDLRVEFIFANKTDEQVANYTDSLIKRCTLPQRG